MFPYDASSVLAIGYNGPPRGSPNDCCTGEAGVCGCAHAEANAMVKCLPHPGPIIVFCTMTPCVSCAPLLVNWACGRVPLWIYDEVYTGPQASSLGMKILSRANIEVVQARDVGC